MPGFKFGRQIRPASQTVQGLVRQVVVNVRDFGALGDGTTDDTAALQAALAALPTTGGTLHFPQGTYIHNGTPLTRAINNVRIRGDGWGSIIKLKAGVTPGGAVTANLIEITSVSGWIVEDLALDGSAGTNTTDNIGVHWHPIYGVGSDHITVRRVKTTNSLSNGIFVASGSYATVEDNWLDGGNLYNASTTYMSEGGIRCFADHSVIRRNHSLNWWKECYVDAAACTIEGNTFVHGTVRNGDDNNIEVYAPTSQGLVSQRNIVRGNICENVWWEGIQIGGNSDNTVCEGNIIRSSYAMLPAAPVAPAGTISLVAGNVDAGTHYYAYTDLVAGVESKLSPVSVAFVNDGTHQQNSVAGITVGPTGTTARKLYRTKVAGGTVNGPWFLVTTLADNTTTTYTDNTADASLGVQLAQTGGFAGAATIQGQAVGGGGIGIFILAAGTIVRGNQVEGFHKGIWGINSQTDTSSTLLQSINAQIVNNHVFSCVQQDSDQMYGIVAGGDDPLVSGNIVEAAPVIISAVNRPLVHHNKVRNSPVFGIEVLNSQDVTCSGNEVDGCASHGIWINNSDTVVRRATVSGNVSRANTGSAYGILLSWVSYGALVGNEATGNPGMNIACQTCDHVTVSGNTATGGTQYGFRDNAFGGNSDFLTVTGNELRGNTSGPVLRGTGVNNAYRSNAGYNPVVAPSTPAFPATTAWVQNTTGVDVTAHIVGTGVTGTHLYVNSTNSTTGAFDLGTFPALADVSVVIPAAAWFRADYTVGTPTWTWLGN